jgi:hypothetical protein
MNIEREIVTLTPLPLITTMTGALDCCWKGSGMPAKVMADRLGIEYRHFMRMFNVDDSRHFPPDLIEMIMRESRNTLPLEWLAARMGYRIHEQSLGDVLVAIRNALQLTGQSPRFAIHANGRIEPVGGEL